MKIIIRKMRLPDAVRIVELNHELGYLTSLSLVEKQLETILSDCNSQVYVALKQNQVIGYIHGFVSNRLTTEPFAEIGALIVKESSRKLGIGKQLVQHFEEAMSEVVNIRVRCNVNRTAAHEFYKALNYQERKEQKVFELKSN